MRHLTRHKLRTLILSLALILVGCSTGSESQSESSWIASWGSSPFTFQTFGNAEPPSAYYEQTIRQIVRLSVGGDQVRIRFSNEHGATPLVIGAASVALLDSGSSVVSSSIRTLSFGGESSIIIPAGAPAISDPIDLSTTALDELAISIYLPEPTPPSTVHMGRISFISSTGNFTNSTELPSARQDATMAFLSSVIVATTQETRVIVALGDSITDGTASTPFSFNSWPDHFAQRLQENNINDLSIINHGISGNQVLRDGAGISALARFDRDVLATPGLTHIIVMEGINDIGTGGLVFPGAQGPAPGMRSAEEIIAGYQQMINRAHSMSPPIKIFGATLTPFEGTFAGYYTPEKDLIRHQVNDWIRNSNQFDGVIDFDLAIQDPENPNIMRAEYNSGDNLHPGDTGYKRMAEYIDLSLFE